MDDSKGVGRGEFRGIVDVWGERPMNILEAQRQLWAETWAEKKKRPGGRILIALLAETEGFEPSIQV